MTLSVPPLAPSPPGFSVQGAVGIDAVIGTEGDRAAIAGEGHRLTRRCWSGAGSEIDRGAGAGRIEQRTGANNDEGVRRPDHAVAVERRRTDCAAQCDRAAVRRDAICAPGEIDGGEGLARGIEHRVVADPDRQGAGLEAAGAVDARWNFRSMIVHDGDRSTVSRKGCRRR